MCVWWQAKAKQINFEKIYFLQKIFCFNKGKFP